jgi:hypothetical protein
MYIDQEAETKNKRKYIKESRSIGKHSNELKIVSSSYRSYPSILQGH